MKARTGITIALLYATLLQPAAAFQEEQAEPPQKGNPEPEMAAPRKNRISARFIVTAEGKNALPQGSRVELKGDSASCKTLERPPQHLGPGGTSFPDLPACRVKLWIYITGFETKTLSVDLAKYQDAIRILVKIKGPPAVEGSDY